MNDVADKYSIILPVYNGGEYFKDCVRSILAQTQRNFNLIILDNCSTDNNIQWIQSIGDSRISVYGSSEKLSIEQNWARIKDVPKNEFMTMIGHDDLLHPDYLQEMGSLIATYPDASLYQTHFDYIDEKARFVRECLPMEQVQSADQFLAAQMQRKIDSTGTGYMMRSRDFDALGGMPPEYPNLIFSDYELWMKLMLLGYKATSSKKRFSYRLHLSVSRITNGMLYQQAFSLYIFFIKNLMVNEAIKDVVQRYGKDFLLYYCESLSHRLLKTPVEKRAISVAEFIGKCEMFAAELIPDQEFKPRKKWKIKAAELFDHNAAGRSLFKLIKKLGIT